MGEKRYGTRERRLVHLFVDELSRHLGRSLLLPHDDLFTSLPPRVRQTLDCLLEGDSEKQVAARLGLSRHTVHQYVTDLYRRLGVSSRAELLALCLRHRR
jgi:DNA-binding CsgD family transcriptional regulator